MRGLTVLYDADCPLCTFLRGWLSRQPQLVPLDFVPAGSEQARRRFPALDHGSTLVDITVVADGGQVYRAANAWVVCLWALAEYRPTAHRLSSRKGAKLAKGAVIAASKYREALFAQRARAGGVRPVGGRDGRPGYAWAGGAAGRTGSVRGAGPARTTMAGWEYRNDAGWVHVGDPPGRGANPAGTGAVPPAPAPPTCADGTCSTD
ncbi:thiol-disulfide oxidoreductase DCC family protein [Streptomyces sp. NPDC059816]|uniref:thiol-disulfide oxidoreductase DCC family protein n=1 Tax=Streptomyces sp. NPDC059816 TaxID=3346960 RepID=UPI0036542EFF